MLGGGHCIMRALWVLTGPTGLPELACSQGKQQGNVLCFKTGMSLTLPVCDQTMGSHLSVCPIYIDYFWNLQRGPHRYPQTIMLAAATWESRLPHTIFLSCSCGCWSQYWVCMDVTDGPICCLCTYPEPPAQEAWTVLGSKKREGDKFPFQLSATFYQPGSEAFLLEFWDVSHKKFG